LVAGLAWLTTAVLAALVVTTAKPVVLIAAGAVLLVVARFAKRYGSGVLIGVLLLGGVNALPGPDLSASLRNSITWQDAVVGALILVLIRENLRAPGNVLRDTPAGRALVIWCYVFSAWYGYTVLHTWLTTPVPLIHTLTFSRQYIYMTVLLPLLITPLGNPTTRRAVLLVVACGAIVSCFAQVAVVAAGIRLPFLLHISYQAQSTTLGLTRILGVAADLPFGLLPFGCALLLYGQRGRTRVAGGISAALAVAAIALGLTRAMYLGAAAGLVTAAVLTLLTPGARGVIGRTRLLTTACAIAAATAILPAYLPATTAGSPLAAVERRADSLVSYLAHGQTDSSIQERDIETSSISYAIRGHWLSGLGELDPTYDYVATGGVPSGDIDNVDVTLLGNIALIGIVGVTLFSLPAICCFIWLLYDWFKSSRRPTPDDAIRFGGVAWCVAAVAVTPTLGLTMSASEVVGSAFVFALLLSSLCDDGQSATYERSVAAPGNDPRLG
jgi:hypothetical protein